MWVPAAAWPRPCRRRARLLEPAVKPLMVAGGALLARRLSFVTGGSATSSTAGRSTAGRRDRGLDAGGDGQLRGAAASRSRRCSSSPCSPSRSPRRRPCGAGRRRRTAVSDDPCFQGATSGPAIDAGPEPRRARRRASRRDGRRRVDEEALRNAVAEARNLLDQQRATRTSCDQPCDAPNNWARARP